MSGFLTGLIARHAGVAEVIRPHVPALFEPLPGMAPMAADPYGDGGGSEASALAGVEAHALGDAAWREPLDDERASAWRPAGGRTGADAARRPASGDGAMRGAAPGAADAAWRVASAFQQTPPAAAPQSSADRAAPGVSSREPRLATQPERSAAVDPSGQQQTMRGPQRPAVATMHEETALLHENIGLVTAARARARDAAQPAQREARTAGVLPPMPPLRAEPQADASRDSGLPPRRSLREEPGPGNEAGNDPARHREPETTVHVTIGRLEIRAEQAPSGSAPRPRDGPRAASLADYLRASAARSRA